MFSENLATTRQYDPSTGRFLSRDHAKSGSNWYSYCENNPINFADPNGLTFVPSIVGQVITGYTRHGLIQAIGRDGGIGVSPRIILKIVREATPVTETDQLGRVSVAYETQAGKVSLNPQGKVISARSYSTVGTRSAGSGGSLGAVFTVVVGLEVAREGFRTVYSWERRTRSVIDVIDAAEEGDDAPGSPRDIKFRKKMGEEFDYQ